MIFLKTERLLIRNVASHDVPEMVDYRNNDLCAQFQRGQTKDADGIAALVERRKNDLLSVDAPAMLAAALRDTDEMIGEIVVMPQDGTISLGYTFSYRVHRQGYAYEALSALIALLHERSPEWDFVCFTDARNIPSRRLLLKLGYMDYGYLPSKDSQVYGKWLRQDTRDEIAQAVSSASGSPQADGRPQLPSAEKV